MRRVPFRRVNLHSYEVNLREAERKLIQVLVADLHKMLSRPLDGHRSPHGDPAVAALFPATYPDDPVAEMEHRDLMGFDPLKSRLSALRVVAETIELDEIESDVIHAWIQSFNSLRVILARRVHAEPQEPSPHEDFEPTFLERLAGMSDSSAGEPADVDLNNLQLLVDETSPDGHHDLFHWFSDLLACAVEAMSKVPPHEGPVAHS